VSLRGVSVVPRAVSVSCFYKSIHPMAMTILGATTATSTISSRCAAARSEFVCLCACVFVLVACLSVNLFVSCVCLVTCVEYCLRVREC